MTTTDHTKQELPGMTGKGVERTSIPEIDDAIDDFLLRKERHDETGKRLSEAHDELIELLREKVTPDPDGVIIYKHDHLTATLLKEDKLKVKGSRKQKDNGAEPDA